MTIEVKVNLIYASDENDNIGLNGDMPWGKSMKADLNNFKKLTTNQAVIMGRKTYETLRGPLPNRLNIVMTRNVKYDPPELRVMKKMPTGFKSVWNEELNSFDLITVLEDTSYQTVSISVEQAINTAVLFGYSEVFIMGGAQIYEEFLPYADFIYLTKVHAYLEGDTKFSINKEEWKEIYKEDHKKDEHNPYDYSFLVYEKN